MATLPSHVGYNFTNILHHDIYTSIDPRKSDLSQPSKVVLITGAGRGIGRSIALRYADSGVACIILCARTSSELDEVEQEIKRANSDVIVRKLTLDITDEKQVMLAANKVKVEGRLDTLINNAGVSSKWVPITEDDVGCYWNVWTVHIKGTYLMLRTFLPLLVETAKREKTQVDIVNMTSIGGHITSPGASAYQTSKFALLRLTEFVSSEYEEHGVNCVAVHPGGVLTAMSKTVPAIQSSMTYPYSADFLFLLTPVVLIDTPDLCAGFVVWFTKGQKSWLNGRYLSASWDVDELEARKDEIVEGDKLKMRMVV
jgi:NAD(P)-dependent dehydrogenase (short-subunit alcohol dehydrogenase family)